MMLSLLSYYGLRFLIIIYFLKRFCFWGYFWQLKQYRWRRIKEELSRNQKLIAWKTSFLSFCLLSFSFGFPYAFYLLTPWYFVFLGLYAFAKIFRGQWSLPKKFTAKITLILSLAVLGLASLFLLHQTQQLQGFLALDILLPIAFAIIVKVVEIPAFFAKRAIIQKAVRKRKQFKNLRVIGITGSYGKTSVKEFLAILLKGREGAEKVLVTPHNVNTKLGIAKLILNSLNKKHRFFICEMGAYHRHEITQMAQLVKPQIGILTGLNEQHLALFGSLQNTQRAKEELIQSLPPDGLALFNGDDARVLKIYEKTKRRKAFATTIESRPGAALIAKNIKVFKSHLSFNLSDGQDSCFLDLPLVGRSNIINLLLASLAARFLGFSLSEIKKYFSASSFSSFQRLKHSQQFDIILSTYSTNPDGFQADLQHLQLWSGERWVITPGIIELGSKAHEIHFQLGQALAETADVVILTKNYYLADIEKGLQDHKTQRQTKLYYIPSPQEILKKMKKTWPPESVVLLEGRVPDLITKNL